MSLRRFGIDIRLERLARLVAGRLEHYNKMGFGLNETLRKVPQECGTSVEWTYINNKLVIGQWYVMRMLRSNPKLLPELVKRKLVYIWG